MSNDQLVLTVTEAATMLGISRTLAYELVARSELPFLRLGRRIVIPRRALERLLETGSLVDAAAETGCGPARGWNDVGNASTG